MQLFGGMKLCKKRIAQEVPIAQNKRQDTSSSACGVTITDVVKEPSLVPPENSSSENESRMYIALFSYEARTSGDLEF